MSAASNAETPDQPGTGEWENEGGSLMPDRNLPVGMTAKVVTHYTVGPYIYSDFDLAFDELQRQRAAIETVLR